MKRCPTMAQTKLKYNHSRHFFSWCNIFLTIFIQINHSYMSLHSSYHVYAWVSLMNHKNGLDFGQITSWPLTIPNGIPNICERDSYQFQIICSDTPLELHIIWTLSRCEIFVFWAASWFYWRVRFIHSMLFHGFRSLDTLRLQQKWFIKSKVFRLTFLWFDGNASCV